jgi:O-acetyl-ADP-ribose deacetylase (regulator of RNase III)
MRRGGKISMIEFTTGDMFATPADIRVNTVNCVGVMGAGVALAFKERFPQMFQDYRRACNAGEIKPGHLHYWKDLFGELIINFPTKRHWREPSRYEDIEVGLKALRKYLAQEGKVRVVLPALGCGHGGLDWDRVSQMIRKHLADLEAEIIVFNPLSSRNADSEFRQDYDESYPEIMRSEGVTIARPGDKEFPDVLKGTSAATLYIKGDPSMLDRSLLAVLPSLKPSQREVSAATACINAIVRPGITLIVGYGPSIERPITRIAISKGADVVIMLADGIANFRIRQDLQDIWDDSRITVITAAKPSQKWYPGAASRAKDLQLTLAKVGLITDPSPRWISKFIKERASFQQPRLFYVNYQLDGGPTNEILEVGAKPIGRIADTGEPNVAPIMECLEADNEVVGSEEVVSEAKVPKGRPTKESDAKKKIEWSGEVPPQQFKNLYSKVLSRLEGGKSLRITVHVEVGPDGEISEQKIKEIKAALKELGLTDDLQTS